MLELLSYKKQDHASNGKHCGLLLTQTQLVRVNYLLITFFALSLKNNFFSIGILKSIRVASNPKI